MESQKPGSGSLYLPRMAEIVQVQRLTEKEKLFTLRLERNQALGQHPGQFVEVSVFGIGEAPISVSSSPTRNGTFELCIRAVGDVTNALHRMGPGDWVGIRGPFGHGFPVEKMRGKDLLFAAGGLGLAPLRSLIQFVLDERESFGRVIILYGARNPSELLFTDELTEWAGRPDVEFHLTVDRADPGWSGHVGVITTLFPGVTVNPRSEVVLTVIRLHRLANEWCDLIGGRTTHPINAVVNGWTSLPTEEQLSALRSRIEAAIPDAWAIVEVFKTLPIPAFRRDTEYLALKHPDEYAFYEGDIASTDGGTTPVPDYRKKVIEFVVPYSTSKRARSDRRPSYAVGALARFNNNYEQLSPGAKEAAALGLVPVCTNPFMNTVAQVVEVVHALEDSLHLIDLLLARGLHREDTAVQVRAGHGVGAVEVPRGVLFHEYTLDERGLVVEANLVIPTGQNHQNIEDDMGVLIPQVIERPQEEIRLLLEMLVRAYDPCISCSTHLLEVEFR